MPCYGRPFVFYSPSPHLTPCYQLYQPKKKYDPSLLPESSGTEDFLFQQVSDMAEPKKSHGKEAIRMNAKTIIGIALVAVIIGVLTFLKIKGRRR